MIEVKCGKCGKLEFYHIYCSDCYESLKQIINYLKEQQELPKKIEEALKNIK